MNNKKLCASLDLIKPGTKAKITRVLGRGLSRRRMMDMGLVPGAVVEMERVAPLGDPIEIKIKDFHYGQELEKELTGVENMLDCRHKEGNCFMEMDALCCGI